MSRHELNFSIQEAGSLLYLADRGFGGHPVNEFHEFFGGREGLRELTLEGAVIAGSLYQDDGFNIRVIWGDLTEAESSGWTSRMAGKLSLPSGLLVVSGVCDETLEQYMSTWARSEEGGDYELGAFVEVEPGEYSVSVYGYPPNDLAGGWMALSEKYIFKQSFPDQAFEKPLDYFNRTRPGEEPRAWIKEGWEDTNFLDFSIQLSPLDQQAPEPQFEDDGTLKWLFRKPDHFPVGIEI